MSTQKIAILTSGGDASGMNAAIRAITRAALDQNWQVLGVRNGFQGLLDRDFIPLNSRAVGGISQQGGTLLGSSRCLSFKTEAGQNQALENLRAESVDALIVIGGNGSQMGAYALSQKAFPVIGIASTIDNDLYGAEISLGVDTALNIALESIDRLKTTAASHHRATLVEVMGRHCGYLALMSGIAGGAEVIVVPEFPMEAEQIAQELIQAYQRGKTHALAVVAEGSPWNAKTLAPYFQEHREQIGFDLRVTVLGHVQRGGVPSVFDRLLATRSGIAAVQKIAAGEQGLLLGMQQGQIVATPFSEVVGKEKILDPELMRLARILST